MLYTWENAKGAQVVDIQSGETFSRVMEVNTSAGWIKVQDEPPRIDAQGRVIGHRIRFESIHPIWGYEHAPAAFHCYGRIW